MLLFLAQAATDTAAKAPGLDPVVSNWIVGALGALALYDQLSKLFGKKPPEKREISGTVDTKPAQQPADKTEVEKELEKLNASLEDIRKKIECKYEELREQIESKDEELRDLIGNKHETLMHAGELRAEKITGRIDTEIHAIRQDVSSRCSAIHEKITAAHAKDAAHDEAIGTLKITVNEHGKQIATIHQQMPPKGGRAH